MWRDRGKEKKKGEEMERSILKSGKLQRLREESLWQRGAKTVTDQVEKYWEREEYRQERDIGGEEAGYLGKEGQIG